jgi:hypothetical protein
MTLTDIGRVPAVDLEEPDDDLVRNEEWLTSSRWNLPETSFKWAGARSLRVTCDQLQ